MPNLVEDKNTVPYGISRKGMAVRRAQAPFRGIMAARKQVRCGPDMYGHNLPAARVGVFAH